MSHPSRPPSSLLTASSGFTLIELVIVLAVLAIMVSLAYPSYVEHVAKANRSSGQQFLMTLSQTEEQYFNDARSYGSTLTALNMTLPSDVSANYSTPSISVTSSPATFVAVLVPTTTGRMANDGPLAINSQGQRWRSCTSGCSTSPNSCTYDPAVDKLWDDYSKC